MDFRSLPDMLRTNANRYGDKAAMLIKSGDEWKEITYTEFGEKVRLIAEGLVSLGIAAGEKVALLSENRPEWSMSDFGIQSAKAIVVPVYPTLIGKQIEYILRNSGAKFIIASTAEQAEKVFPLLDSIENLSKLILMEGVSNFDNENIISFDDLLEAGKQYRKNNENWYHETIDKIDKMEMMTIIYTSGTTGDPKGVMLCHNNFMSNIEAVLEPIPISEEDTFLSFLPLSHVFERMAGNFVPYALGSTVAFAESIEKVAENMGEVHPTIMTSVPRLYEKMYTKINIAVDEGSPVKRKLFRWSFRIGDEMQKAQKAGTVSAGLKFKHGIASKLVFSKLKTRMGGKLRFFVSGGAPLSKEIGEFFSMAGITIIECYGLTETSPGITAGVAGDVVFGTVGPPLNNVEVKLAEDGEILTRGPHVMLGYHDNEEATKEIIDSDGWLHTGDIGEFDEGGRLKITDRKKNILVTAGGKNIAPAPIENMLITSPIIEQIMLIGDRRKFISAVIAPDYINLKSLAEKRGISISSNEELVSDPEVYKLMEEELDKLLVDVSNFERVKKFIMIPRLLTIEDGEITPSLKIKRKVIIEKFAGQIDALYED